MFNGKVIFPPPHCILLNLSSQTLHDKYLSFAIFTTLLIWQGFIGNKFVDFQHNSLAERLFFLNNLFNISESFEIILHLINIAIRSVNFGWNIYFNITV
ncbi:hypothetical protein A3G06_00880 [Candidatus Nomurabacteria bacterium RIFCSPLOWO2_12_FULL_46_14]|uniref:Uncharacterized protein n=1 Tax=Candidatus Nomurabacteria bacterium RIFCSPLOWO2_12_FULL_46_14 TaxID=1801797 RepID=A0A1F6YAN3_9BACT|nr:MAG: hypothetical protein A3G06_00880 [Candidatus Nomurabacteria bacterium RIFCSPLOWO2_12_FULL_46_14]